MTYKPRNCNPPIDRVRKSWSSAFDDIVERKSRQRAPCGFDVMAGHAPKESER